MNVQQKRHAPFFCGVAAGLASVPFSLRWQPDLTVEIAAVLFFLGYLVFIGIRIPTLTGAYLRKNAAGADEPAILIFAATLLAVSVSIASMFSALNSKGGSTLEVVLAFASVALGWLTIHTMAAMHYAHLYWSPPPSRPHASSRQGLSFPETKEPGSYDFLYFSFVIGMTAQTSDVEITTTAMRRINLVHAIISFFFNTVLVAAAVNAAVSLAQA